MAEDLFGIIHKKESRNPIIDCEWAPYEIPFYKDEEYFSSLENYVYFVKQCEKMVRMNPLYKKYVGYIKFDVGLSKCQVLNHIEEDDDSDYLEMHHGPLLSLFDYCAIITDYMIKKNMKITTFSVADIVLKEHYANNVQVVVLSKTVHQAVHEFGGPFINLKQGFGDIDKFLKKYKLGLQPEQIVKINNYIELSKKYDSFDKGLFDLGENVKRWSQELEF